MKHPIKTSLTLACIGVLSACGSGSEDDNTNEVPPVLYVAAADSAATADDQPVTIDVAANDTSDNQDDFEITAVTQPENGTAEISEQAIVYTPNAGFAGIDTFSYTATDGTQAGTAEVTVSVAQTVSIAGRAVDSPIANAIITMTVGSETFTAEADANGDFVLDLSLLDLSPSSVLELKATGAGEQSYVTLSSRLLTLEELFSAAGADRILDSSKSNDVVVTQLTTALNHQLTELAAGEPITAATRNHLMQQVDPDLMLEMAALIKLLLDDANYSLPEGFATIEELLAAPEAYNTLLVEAEAAGDLQAMIAATISDTAVLPAIDAAQYAGDYQLLIDYHQYNAAQSFASYSIDSDGALYVSRFNSGETLRVPYVNGKWVGTLSKSDNTAAISSFVANYGKYYAAEAELFDKFVASKGGVDGYTSVDFSMRTEVEATLLDASASSITYHEVLVSYIGEIAFEYQGEQLVLPETAAFNTVDVNTEFNVEVFKSGLAFDMSALSKSMLFSQFDGYNNTVIVESFGVEPFYVFTVLPTEFHPDSDISGTFTRGTISGGSYELSSDKTKLTLTYDDTGMDYQTEELYLVSDKDNAEIVLSKRIQTSGQYSWSLGYLPTLDETHNASEIVVDKLLWSRNSFDQNGEFLPLVKRVGSQAVNHANNGQRFVTSVVCDEVAQGGNQWEDCLAASLQTSETPSGSWQAHDTTNLLTDKQCFENECGGTFVSITGQFDAGVMARTRSALYPANTGPYGQWVIPGQVQTWAGNFDFVKTQDLSGAGAATSAADVFVKPTDAYQRALPWALSGARKLNIK